MRVERIVRVLETLFRGIGPQILVRRGNRHSILVEFIFGDKVPLPSPFGLLLNADDF